MVYKILGINPGSTPTKVAIFQSERIVSQEPIRDSKSTLVRLNRRPRPAAPCRFCQERVKRESAWSRAPRRWPLVEFAPNSGQRLCSRCWNEDDLMIKNPDHPLHHARTLGVGL